MSKPQRSSPCTRIDESRTGVTPAALTILPPLEDPGEEPLFRIVYIIDVNALCQDEAARATYQIMSDPASMPPVLEVIDHAGHTRTVDLSEAGVAGDLSDDFTRESVHPLIRQIHDLLYLDMQDGRDFYNPDKQWDSHTMSMIADVVAEHIPWPSTRSEATADINRAAPEADSPCTRKWKCPCCGRIIEHSYADLVHIGIPICGDCDVDMEMT